MVPKRTIHRQRPLILITIGSSLIPFTRLCKSILDCKDVVLTIMEQSYRNDLLENELIAAISQADKIITHAAPGSLYLIANYAKNMPLIIPRRQSFKEAVGDHQLYFARYISDKLPKRYKKYVVLEEKISIPISQYLTYKKEKNILKKYLFPNSSRMLFKKSFTKLLVQEELIESDMAY